VPTVNFRLRIKEWKHLSENSLEALMRQSIQQMAFRVVEATPVDTGFLRGSWQPNINAMAKAQPGGKGKKAANDKSGAAAFAKIAATVVGMKPGDTFYMSNNAVYALRMEFGFNGTDALGRRYRQPGRYFVTGTAAQWPSIVAGVAQSLGLNGGPGGGAPYAPPASPGGGGSSGGGGAAMPAAKPYVPRKLGPVELPKASRPRNQYDK
jgi:hypothetical protein